MSEAPGLAARVAVSLVAVLFTLLAFEGTLRLYDRLREMREEHGLPPVKRRALVPSDDPELIFEFNPGWRDDDFRVNAHGMPDAERTPAKPPGVFRLAFVGDSVTANFGLVAQDEAFPAVVGELLARDPAHRFEVLNFGVQGYSIQQGLRMARTRVRTFDPDLLVAQLCLNDPYPSDTPYASVPRGLSLRSVTFLWRRLQPARFWAYQFVQRNYDEQGWENVRRAFQGYALLDEELPTLTVLFPYLYRPAYERWRFGEIHAGYAEAARRAGVPLLDLWHPFDETGLITDTWPQDPIHPDPAGHRLAAEAIVAELRSRKLLPGREAAAR